MITNVVASILLAQAISSCAFTRVLKSYLQFINQLPAKFEPAKSPPAASDPSKLLAKSVMKSCDKEESTHVED